MCYTDQVGGGVLHSVALNLEPSQFLSGWREKKGSLFVPTLSESRVGDEVVIIGRQGDLEITPAEVATRNGLGLHHVATTAGPWVARVYVSA